MRVCAHGPPADRYGIATVPGREQPSGQGAGHSKGERCRHWVPAQREARAAGAPALGVLGDPVQGAYRAEKPAPRYRGARDTGVSWCAIRDSNPEPAD